MRETQLGRDSHTIFLSSHLLGEVEQVCTDVAIVQHGEMKLHGKARDLLARTTSFLIEAAPPDRALALLRAYPELNAQPREDGTISRRRSRPGPSAGQRGRRYLRPAGAP